MVFSRWLWIFGILVYVGCSQRQNFLSWNGLENKQIEKVDGKDLKGEGPSTYRGRFGKFDIQITTRDENEAEAEKLFEGTRLAIESYYQKSASPYPGFISRIIECPEALKPQPVSGEKIGQWSRGFLVYTNARRTLGVCDEKALSYRLLHFMHFCKKPRRSFSVKVFEDGGQGGFDDLKRIFNGFNCGE